MKCKLCKKSITKSKDLILSLRQGKGRRHSNMHWKCFLKQADKLVVKNIVEFVSNFNAKLFYRNPKLLINIVEDLHKALCKNK